MVAIAPGISRDRRLATSSSAKRFAVAPARWAGKLMGLLRVFRFKVASWSGVEGNVETGGMLAILACSACQAGDARRPMGSIFFSASHSHKTQNLPNIQPRHGEFSSVSPSTESTTYAVGTFAVYVTHQRLPNFLSHQS